MKKLLLTFILLACVSAVSFAQAGGADMRPLTSTELIAAQNTATTKANSLQTALGLSTAQYTDVVDCEFTFQKQYDRYVVNGVTPCVGQLGNITVQRDQRMEQILTPAQYSTYLTIPH